MGDVIPRHCLVSKKNFGLQKVLIQMEGNNLFSLTLVRALLGDLERKAVLIKSPALIELF